MDPFTEDALKKLVVADLRAMCKERKIVGFSKATKAVTIQKLLDYQAGPGAAKKIAIPETMTTTANKSPARSAKFEPVAQKSSGETAPIVPSQQRTTNPATAEGTERVCPNCGQAGRYKDGKCVEKWGPGPKGPGTLCQKCYRRRLKQEKEKAGQQPDTSAASQSSTTIPKGPNPVPARVIAPSKSRNVSMLSGPSIATEPSQTAPLSQFSFSSQLPPSQLQNAPSQPTQASIQRKNASSQPNDASDQPLDLSLHGTDASKHSSVAPLFSTTLATRSSSPLVDLPPRPAATNPPSVKKRKAKTHENDPPKAKKQKTDMHPKLNTPTHFEKQSKPCSKSTTVIPNTIASAPASTLLPAMPLPPNRKPLIHSTNVKRFTPLVVKQPIFAPIKPPQKTLSQQGRSQIYLDFTDTVPASLENISLPPSLSNRKLVPRYALILSQVEENDMKSCVLVSKMFRYAVYISASYRLLHSFSGLRFGLLLQTYPQNMTDMWPYLRQRQEELADRLAKYHASFLHAVFKGKNLIASRLWTSPDHEKQITVAIRFLLTRLFFCVSVGQTSDWVDGQIIDVRQLVQGEIWCITMQHLASTESFYVLEATCEVVGRPMDCSSPKPRSNISVRADWSDYIESRAQPLAIPPQPLMEHVRWTNHEEYERGISRHWLKRVRREGMLGFVKEHIAERYVLACVVDNSVSGKWKSSTEMAQDFAGLDSVASLSTKPRVQKVNLFLPAHHHVESVHFNTVSGAALHPALAIIQTPSREYFILKDNGMQVGSEEEGVAQVWMDLLRCANNGESL